VTPSHRLSLGLCVVPGDITRIGECLAIAVGSPCNPAVNHVQVWAGTSQRTDVVIDPGVLGTIDFIRVAEDGGSAAVGGTHSAWSYIVGLSS
jgi:hypothetical protein